ADAARASGDLALLPSIRHNDQPDERSRRRRRSQEDQTSHIFHPQDEATIPNVSPADGPPVLQHSLQLGPILIALALALKIGLTYVYFRVILPMLAGTSWVLTADDMESYGRLDLEHWSRVHFSLVFNLDCTIHTCRTTLRGVYEKLKKKREGMRVASLASSSGGSGNATAASSGAKSKTRDASATAAPANKSAPQTLNKSTTGSSSRPSSRVIADTRRSRSLLSRRSRHQSARLEYGSRSHECPIRGMLENANSGRRADGQRSQTFVKEGGWNGSDNCYNLWQRSQSPDCSSHVSSL
ncbi:hypothetical protein ACHAWF_001387, partial [Thalassiosira exigua]